MATTMFVVFALLFSQLALAGYACFGAASAPVPPRSMQMADGQPCEGMVGMQVAEDQAVLCHQHCVNAPQSFDPAQPPSPAPAAIVQVLVAAVFDDVAFSTRASYGHGRDSRPPPDPLFLSTLRLRV